MSGDIAAERRAARLEAQLTDSATARVQLEAELEHVQSENSELLAAEAARSGCHEGGRAITAMKASAKPMSQKQSHAHVAWKYTRTQTNRR